MNKLTFAALALMATAATAQQKQIYIPADLRPYDLSADTSRWSWRHSTQTQNLVFFWEKPFGDDPSCPPDLEGQPMRFDIGNLQTRVESFYHFFRDSLNFTLPGSKCDTYKMMVMVNYSLEGTAYGGAYDDFIGALWVTPNRIQDKKLNCLAHELGHSFQTQIMADSTGEAWGGCGFFEMTSQWMLWQVNPDWLTDERYHFEAFRNLTHKGFLHLDNIYHSPFVIEWWAERHGRTCIADLYREGKVGEDPAMTYMRKYGLSQSQFCDEMYECYAHLLNFDFTHARRESRPYACTFSTKMLTAPDGWLTPDTALVPENYGFNAIKIDAPESGKTVRVDFKALNGTGAGHRYGLVAVTTADECIYGPMQSKPKGRMTFTTPQGKQIKALYVLVMGAPATHSQDPSSRKFPYAIKVR